MRTTIDLPDDLATQVKLRAALEGKKQKEVLLELLRRGLSHPPQVPRQRAYGEIPVVVETPPEYTIKPLTNAEIDEMEDAELIKKADGSA